MNIEDDAKKSRNKIFSILLMLTIVFLPFNDLPFYGMKGLLGGLYAEGSLYIIYPTIILCIFYALTNKKIIIPHNNSVKAVFLFIVINIVSGVFNYKNIINSSLKGITGISRYISQMEALVLCFIVSIIIYYICIICNLNFDKIRKYILVSFTIVSLYSIIEIPSIFGNSFTTSILQQISLYIHGANGSVMLLNRVRSVSAEASSLSLYFAFIFPWLLTYAFEKSRKILKVLMIIFFFIMLLLSKSRTGFFAISIELIMFLYMFFRSNRKLRNRAILLVVFLVISLSIFGSSTLTVTNESSSFGSLNILKVFTSITEENNNSNIARIGSQKAALKIGLDHPIVGIGNGQFGFYAPNYYDPQTLESTEIQNWIYVVEGKLPPTYGLLVRVFCENGIIGICIWLYAFYSLLSKCFYIHKKDTRDYFPICIIISTIGMIITQFDVEQYSFIELWITFGIGWYLIRRKVS